MTMKIQQNEHEFFLFQLVNSYLKHSESKVIFNDKDV